MEKGSIHLLSPEVVGQIAAGEVVERPSAAIKELVENSLDAGATAVTVDIKEGGIASFRVTDNGCGIAPSDIRMAFERHATSKIQTANDLYAVETLGFRGEALASIAAVARVRCTTRARGRDEGLTLENNGGVISDIKAAACPEGTTFLVKELFYNAPVRRKFLKKPSAETSLVSDLMARLILSHPSISFRYLADGKTVFFSAGDGKLESAALSVYGMDVLRLLTPVSGNMNGILLNGFVGVGDVARGNRAYESFFLNGRAMKSALLSSAVENACRQRVTIGRFPMCILHLRMPFDAADVNVHPNKWEVRFQNERGVREAVETLVFEALTQGQRAALTAPKLFDNPIAERRQPQALVTARPPENVEAFRRTEQSNGEKTDANNQAAAVSAPPRADYPALAPPVIVRSSTVPSFSAPSFSKSTITAFHESVSLLHPRLDEASHVPDAVQSSVPVPVPSTTAQVPPPQQSAEPTVQNLFADQPPRVIGTAFNTYILMEYGDELLLCDQHAAHERLLYERLVRETASAPASQALMIPQAVRLTHMEYAAFEENRDALQNAGFDVSPFGGDTVQLRGVPMVLGQPEAERCFRDALDEISACGQITLLERTQRIMQMACKHAVKGGEKLPLTELVDLIHQILKQDIPPTCPHGRPIMVTLSHTELDKRFRRIQS